MWLLWALSLYYIDVTIVFCGTPEHNSMPSKQCNFKIYHYIKQTSNLPCLISELSNPKNAWMSSAFEFLCICPKYPQIDSYLWNKCEHMHAYTIHTIAEVPKNILVTLTLTRGKKVSQCQKEKNNIPNTTAFLIYWLRSKINITKNHVGNFHSNRCTEYRQKLRRTYKPRQRQKLCLHSCCR